MVPNNNRTSLVLYLCTVAGFVLIICPLFCSNAEPTEILVLKSVDNDPDHTVLSSGNVLKVPGNGLCLSPEVSFVLKKNYNLLSNYVKNSDGIGHEILRIYYF